MTNKEVRAEYILNLAHVACDGRVWFAKKVVVILWPGLPADRDTVDLKLIRVKPFATHLEAGMWLDMHPAGWSYMVATGKTPLLDLTQLTWMW